MMHLNTILHHRVALAFRWTAEVLWVDQKGLHRVAESLCISVVPGNIGLKCCTALGKQFSPPAAPC